MTKQPGPGRPVTTGRGTTAGGRRINVSCSPAEYDAIAAGAAARGMSPAKYALLAALAAARKERK